MPIIPFTPGPQYKVNDILRDAMIEIGAYSQDETPTQADNAFALAKLNDIYNEWNVDKQFVYNINFSVFPFVLTHHPTTIGPTGDYQVAQRPVRIESASAILIGSGYNSPVDVPITIRDEYWWAAQSVKDQLSTFPTDLYYSDSFPNGEINFWPIPTQNNNVRLEIWNVLTEFVDPTVVFSAPPGYRKALKLTLAEELCEPFGRQAGPMLVRSAMKARARIAANNVVTPSQGTADIGLPGRRGGAFNYLIRQYTK